MKTSYNEACGRDCSTLEQDLALCEQAGFDYIEIRLDMLRRYLQGHTADPARLRVRGDGLGGDLPPGVLGPPAPVGGGKRLPHPSAGAGRKRLPVRGRAAPACRTDRKQFKEETPWTSHD